MSDGFVSIIVPAYNAAATIGACVEALSQQDYPGPYEIIVVDDGSGDDTAAIARQAGATVITTPRGRPASARNTGIRAARGDIICFTDADCIPHADWLRCITEPLSDPSVAGCKGIYATRQRSLVARFVQLEYEDKYDYMRPQPAIDFIDTYSCAYRRTVLLANGGFDERFHFAEDQELSFRLAGHGYRMVFQESAVVDHHHVATMAAYLRKKTIIGYWKAQIVRRFRGKRIRDSHTPQVMKVQIILATLFLGLFGAGAGGALWGTKRPFSAGAWLLAPAGLVALAFLYTTLPFIAKAWPKDRAVAVASPILLFGRAVALAWGVAHGVLLPRSDIKTAETFNKPVSETE